MTPATETKQYPKQSNKLYRCTQCGFEMMIKTNHFGNCWSNGNFNTCPKCPPYKKYPTIVEGGVLKLMGGQTIWECIEIATKTDWDKSKLSLGEFINIGQEVDEDLYYYFLEVLPPATNTSKCLQIGEPYDSQQGHFTYSTLESIDGDKWIYTGIKTTPKYWSN